MRKRPGEKRDNWLLIKSDDEAARAREGSGHSGGEAEIGGERPHHRGDRQGRRRRGLALEQVGRREREADQEGGEEGEDSGAKEEGRQESPEGQAEVARRISRRPKCCAAQPARGAPCPPLSPPQLATPAGQAAGRQELRPRGEVRRLPHPGAARPTARSSCSRARASTGRRSFNPSPTRSRNSTPTSALIDGEIVVEEKRHQRFLRPAGRAQAQQGRALRLLRVRSAASRRRRPHRPSR